MLLYAFPCCFFIVLTYRFHFFASALSANKQHYTSKAIGMNFTPPIGRIPADEESPLPYGVKNILHHIFRPRCISAPQAKLRISNEPRILRGAKFVECFPIQHS